MKSFFNALMLGGFCLLLVPGCGDAAPTSVVEGASKTDIQKYEEMVAADAAAMTASQNESTPNAATPAAEAPK